MGLLYRVPFLEKGTFDFRTSAVVRSRPASTCENRGRKTPCYVVVSFARDQEAFL
jgi:hypothetical protein